ncbi:MAG: hypothetical protein ACFB50_17270 [Rubrobacteraceae bacterium]
MAQCEVCGNAYDRAFQVAASGDAEHTFDIFECAIHALAPPAPTAPKLPGPEKCRTGSSSARSPRA